MDATVPDCATFWAFSSPQERASRKGIQFLFCPECCADRAAISGGPGERLDDDLVRLQ